MEPTKPWISLIRPTKRILATAVALFIILPEPDATAQETIVLYQNDFESPNQAPVLNCGLALDTTPINVLFGTEENQFHQRNTVEAVLIDDPIYTDSSGAGGSHAIGMLSSAQDDLLALTFDSKKLGFINVFMDISSIDVQGCGGPFGVADPIYRVSLVDSPEGAYSIGFGTVLDQKEVTGPVGPDNFTFLWTRVRFSLDASASTDGIVTVVWDLLQSGYAAFDNLRIEASSEAVSTEDDDPTYPSSGVLSAVYPSPFSSRAAFSLELTRGEDVRVTVYDIMGRPVRGLHSGRLGPGTHSFSVDGSDLPPGVYLVEAAGEGFRAIRRSTLVR